MGSRLRDESKNTPRHNYERVLEDYCAELLRVPDAVVKTAYAFRDFLEANIIGDYKHSIEVWHPFVISKEKDRMERTESVSYLIKVWAESRSVYHNDTETTKGLTVEVNHAATRGFDARRLPWAKV